MLIASSNGKLSSSLLLPASLLIVAVAVGAYEKVQLKPGCHLKPTFCLQPFHICKKIVCDGSTDGSHQAGEAQPSHPTELPKRSKPTFMRLGKRAANFMRFGKRASNFMRFGKRSNVIEPVLIESNLVPYDAIYDDDSVDDDVQPTERVLRGQWIGMRLGR